MGLSFCLCLLQFNGMHMMDFVEQQSHSLDENTRLKIVLPLLKFLYLNANHLPGFSFIDSMILKA